MEEHNRTKDVISNVTSQQEVLGTISGLSVWCLHVLPPGLNGWHIDQIVWKLSAGSPIVWHGTPGADRQ